MSASNWIACPKCGHDMREDYEFYNAQNGLVKWYYGNECSTCGLKTRFDGEHPFFDPTTIPDPVASIYGDLPL